MTAVRLTASLFILVSGLGEAEAEDRALTPGDTFKHCEICPVMVVIPPGQFMMGAPDDDETAQRFSRPQTRIAIDRAFAIGKYEVTYRQFKACFDAGGCRHEPLPFGWGGARQPLERVSYDDALEYVAWLSQVTGHVYDLPSEAQWEYAARAGTTTAYWWGEDVGHLNAKCLQCDGLGFFSTETCKVPTPIGAFPANASGLHDTAGNVWEFAKDCYHETLDTIPTDGSARLWPDTCERVAMRAWL